MARISLGLTVAGCALIAGLLGHSASGSNPDQRQRNLLAVNVALDQGQTLLQRGDFAAAVIVLEKQIAHIDGNRTYLSTLRDAYRGHVRQLEQSGNVAEAKRIRGFLDILEPIPARAATQRLETPRTESPRVEAPRTEIPRAKVEHDTSDPFHPGNKAAESSTTLLACADRAFAQKNYDEAARYYSRAEQTEANSTAERRERWGYCRLFVAAQKFNRGDVSEALEAEVRAAMRMSPRLETFATALLDKLRQPAKAITVAVKHLGKSGRWNIAETDSLRIFHTGSEQDAESAARTVEATRVAMIRKWFNEEPTAWSPRCEVFLHPTGEAYARDTGAPATAPGHSSISMDNGRVVKRRIDIRLDDANALVGVLPHETTHVVLAGRFGSHHVPRWADEGMAVLSEPRERITLHLRNLPTHRRDGNLFALSELVKQNEYPEGKRIGAFYAQSVSVAEFLCKKKDPLTFTRFLHLGLNSDYETALERYYGYRSFAEMEKDWQAHAFGSEGVAAVSEKRSKSAPNLK